MSLPRLRFTIRRLMDAVAIVALELGCGLYLQRTASNPDIHLPWWLSMGLQLGFVNLVIVAPACMFVVWVHYLGRVDLEPREDR
jgi:hypothetical protein